LCSVCRGAQDRLVMAKCVLGRSLEGGEHAGEAVGMFELSCESVRLKRGAW
jgi:hypothetical protein